MDVCRICLSNSPEKQLCHLKSNEKDDDKGYEEILSFCLDIQVIEDSKITQKLCTKCYRKVLSFYKFKSLALKNDEYLKNLSANCDVKLNVIASENPGNEIYYNYNGIDCLSSNIKEEPNIKEENEEDELPDYQSDEEVLSVIKMIKYEQNDNVGETKENVSAPVKKRGRPKSIKTKSKKCEVCEECGKSVRNMKEHALRHIPMKDRRQIQCKDCDKTFTNYGSRYKHYRIKHLGVKKHCNICNKDVTDLKAHDLIAHNSEKLPFPCVLCARRYISRSTLDAHMLTHTKDKPYECDVCHKKFRLKIVLTTHKRAVHDKEKTNLCQYCSKSFFKKYHLQVHLRSHTKEKPYKCIECGKGFSCSTGLKNHKMTHSTVRSFLCQYCDSSFTRSDYLQKHQRIHTKEKTHPCRYCGLKFGRTDHRRRHEITAHEKHVLAA